MGKTSPPERLDGDVAAAANPSPTASGRSLSGRKDGVATKQRLLAAASAVFAERGFREATVSEISERAGANLASVSYHFGGKEELYAAAWREAFDHTTEVFPPDGGLPDDAPAADHLRALVSSFLHRLLDDGRLGHATRILVMELTHPNDALAEVRQDAIRPINERAQTIVRELLGPSAKEPWITFAVMSVIHQCLALGFRAGRFSAFEDYLEMAKADVDGLADHMTRFSLAGIEAVRRQLEEEDSASS